MSTGVGQVGSAVAWQERRSGPDRPGVLPAPRAARLRRPGWRDPRLLLGVALVGASVLLGSWAVGTAGRTVPVLAATAALVPGEPVRAEAVRVVDVRLPDGAATYVPAGTDLTDLHVTRVVREGELLPASAVATSAEIDVRAVAVTPRGAVSGGVVQGALVDLWFVPEAPRGGADDAAPAPRQLAASLVVAELDASTTAFSVGSGATVHVLVPLPDLAAVLSAVRGPGSVEVVPVPGGAP